MPFGARQGRRRCAEDVHAPYAASDSVRADHRSKAISRCDGGVETRPGGPRPWLERRRLESASTAQAFAARTARHGRPMNRRRRLTTAKRPSLPQSAQSSRPGRGVVAWWTNGLSHGGQGASRPSGRCGARQRHLAAGHGQSGHRVEPRLSQTRPPDGRGCGWSLPPAEDERRSAFEALPSAPQNLSRSRCAPLGGGRTVNDRPLNLDERGARRLIPHVYAVAVRWGERHLASSGLAKSPAA